MSRQRLISATSRIVSLSRSGHLSTAQQLFDEMRNRDTVAWNAMLAAYTRCGFPSRALSLFSDMRSSCTPTDSFTFTSVLAAAANLRHLRGGEKLHSLALRSGLCTHVPVSNSLVDVYGKCWSPSNAKKVFDEMTERNEVTWCSLLHGLVTSGLQDEACKLFDDMPVRNLIAWNIMFMAFASSDEPEISIEFFREMSILGFKGDFLTFTSLINSCTELSNPSSGHMIHALIIQNGWASSVEVTNSLLSFNSKFNFHTDAMIIFESMETRSQVSWNTMIDSRMKLGAVEEALELFQQSPEANLVTWTSMVAGFARNGRGEEALKCFVSLQRSLHLPDEFTFGAALHACAELTVLGNGLMVHGCSLRHGFELFLYVSNGLVNMYAKCGDLRSCDAVFGGIRAKDLVSWNAMIFGFAAHGQALKALKLFEEDMEASGVLPDKLTFLGLLMACCHTGLVEQGIGIFMAMESVHRISPESDHVACAVDILARAGHLRQAAAMLDAFAGVAGGRHGGCCGALLGGSVGYGDVGAGRKAGEQLIGMEPEEEAGYVMLSNLYCSGGRWVEAERVRRVMGERGVKKAPGCSWIEKKDMVVVFGSGAGALDQVADLHEILRVLESEMSHPCLLALEKGS